MADQDETKKPYVKPELVAGTVYEASGGTCCKLTNATCSNAARGGLGKSVRTSTTS